MPPGRRHGAGCWTCRLRRKRCDSTQPICSGCQSLEITCHSGEAKPAWMDGGSRQKHMSETIKTAIKQNALLRRERRLLAQEDHGMIMTIEADPVPRQLLGFNPAAALALASTSHTGDPITHNDPFGAPIASSPSTSSSNTAPSVDRSNESQSPHTVTSWTSGAPTLLSTNHPAAPIQVQLGSVMIYLDYVFPFLFPFYQPSLLETGRQWLLGLLCQNEVSFHLASSLSAYFFSLVPQSDNQDMHDDCKTLVWDKLIEQMDLAIGSIQSTVSAVSNSGAQSPLLDKIRIMQEITQLLVVEVTVRSSVDWSIHLTPALSIFDEVFKIHGLDHSSKPSLDVLSNSLPSSIPMTTQHHKALPNTPDQSALAFFVSLLLFVDIIASTSLGTPPALQAYHDSLLSTRGDSTFPVYLESVIGCQNWVLVAIGNVSSLCAWKRDAKQSGNFSVLDLVKLADPISRALENGLQALDVNSNFQPKKSNASRLKAYYTEHDRVIDPTFAANINRIWAHAAKIYLSVSLSGWQSNSRDIQSSITQILGLLDIIDSPGQLRSLAWPICVAGSLAVPAQENDFRRIIAMMGPMGKFGTLSSASGILEAVWSSRDVIDGNLWDMSLSLSILGSPALLI